MTKKRIHEVYMFLATASMKRLTDEEKIAFIRLLRQMKAVSQELSSAANDAYARAVADGMEDTKAMDFANRAVDDIAQAESDIATETMTKETYTRLVLSNDWNFGQIEELGAILTIQNQTNQQ
jgi:predicted component of type VI protein secretion system